MEDEKQLEKILLVKHELPHLKAIIQYLGTPRQEGVLSWEDLLQLGVKEEDNDLEERIKRICINQCCALIYTSGTTGPPKVTLTTRSWVQAWAVFAICPSLDIFFELFALIFKFNFFSRFFPQILKLSYHE